MGIFVKRRGETEYVYILSGSSQHFLGRRDDPDGINLQALYKATKTIDKNFDKTFAKYLKDIQEYRKYMPESQWEEYVSARLDHINAELGRVYITSK